MVGLWVVVRILHSGWEEVHKECAPVSGGSWILKCKDADCWWKE